MVDRRKPYQLCPYYHFEDLFCQVLKSVYSYKNAFQIVASRAEEGNWLAIVDDLRTANRAQIIPYPELVLKQTQKFIYNTH